MNIYKNIYEYIKIHNWQAVVKCNCACSVYYISKHMLILSGKCKSQKHEYRINIEFK